MLSRCVLHVVSDSGIPGKDLMFSRLKSPTFCYREYMHMRMRMRMYMYCADEANQWICTGCDPCPGVRSLYIRVIARALADHSFCQSDRFAMNSITFYSVIAPSERDHSPSDRAQATRSLHRFTHIVIAASRKRSHKV